MLFNPVALREKNLHLDGILQDRPLLEKVIARWAGEREFSYTVCKRPWDPGGGATLFRVYTADETVFLKVKHLSVTVESRLEQEPAFAELPSLRNEHAFLSRLSPLLPNVPRPLAYFEEEGEAFLFLEMLKPLKEVERRLSALELVEVYGQLEEVARKLHGFGIVHTDIHEQNILFRGGTPILADFEEARELKQGVPFPASLDMVGRNHAGDVGEMPAGAGTLPGYTCLARLREVFRQGVLAKLPPLLRECNFDSSCPFLNALDHGKDPRIYQSVNLPGLRIQGQRQLDDERIPRILETLRKQFDRPIAHLDIGSNLGRFNLELSESDLIRESVGVEAYDKYVELSKVLAFLSGNSKARFFCAECGKDSLFSLLGGRKVDCITIYSVYHHIRNKEAFLLDLRRLAPELILLEMPVQPECYQGRSWQEEMEIICRQLGGGSWELIGETSDYQRPLLAIRDVGRESRGILPLPAASPAPAVSVVLPTYNHLRYLPAAVEGILQQSFGNFELIVVNDGSTDGTREYLDRQSDPRIWVIHQDNKRLPGALNTGFRAARGRYLTWTSADNLCAPLFLEQLVAALGTRPEAGLAFADFAWIDDGGRVLGIQSCAGFRLPRILSSNPGMAAFLYRRECHEEVGYYDPSLEGAEDWDMWIRILERFAACHLPEVLYSYRNHADTMSARIPEKIRNSVHASFRKTLQRHGGALDIELCYPALRGTGDRSLRACAWLDLGMHLLQSPFNWEIYGEQAAHALNQALCLGGDSRTVAHLFSVQQAKYGEWESAEKLGRHAQESLRPEVRESAEMMRVACSRRDLGLVHQVPFPSLPPEARARLYPPNGAAGPAADAPAVSQPARKRGGIAVLSHHYHESGGTELLAGDLARGLAGLGYSTGLIYLTVAPQQRAQGGAPGEKESRVRFLPASRKELLVQAIDELAPEAVILLTDILGENLSHLVELQFGRKFRKIVYLNINNQAFDALELRGDVAAGKAELLRKYDCVVTMFEESLAARFLKKHDIPFEIAAVGIPQPKSAPGSFKKRFAIPEESHLLIYPALIAPMKNQLALIEKEAQIDHNVTIAFLGDLYHPIPEYVEAFRRGLSRSSRCRHLPSLKRDDVAQAMGEASICLFPSLSEGSPLTLIEATSQGLPWLATPEVLFAGKLRGGIIARAEEFPRLVNRLLADPLLLDRLAAEGASFAQTNHRIEGTVQAFSELLRRS